MIPGRRQPIVARADVARSFFAFGLVPLLLARMDVSQIDPPWSFALTPEWSPTQLVAIAVAGVAFGATSDRSVQTLAAVTLGLLSGLAVDLWWLAGWVKPYDQTFVSMLPQAAWRTDLTIATMTLVGVASVGVVAGAIARRSFRGRPETRRRPTASEAIAVGLVVVVAPLVSLGFASVAASSTLVVPDGAQIQTVRVSSDEISVEPVTMRSGLTRFRCRFAQDAAPDWAGLMPLAEGDDVGSIPASFDTSIASCGPEPDSLTWGTIAELAPGRYAWIQIEQTEVPRIVATSSVFAVAP